VAGSAQAIHSALELGSSGIKVEDISPDTSTDFGKLLFKSLPFLDENADCVM
jgi:hypothetical protein